MNQLNMNESQTAFYLCVCESRTLIHLGLQQVTHLSLCAVLKCRMKFDVVLGKSVILTLQILHVAPLLFCVVV